MTSLLSIAGLIVGIILGGAILYLLPPLLVKLYLLRTLDFIAVKQPNICITFDDGPDPRATPQILDALEQHSAKATFFVLGEQAERHPELVKAIADAGHTIGEHSYEHTHAWKTGPIKTWADLIRGGETIQKILQAPSPLYLRPPYGKMNASTLLYLFHRAKKPVFWDIDPEDYAAASAEEIANLVNANLDRGSILLLHDGRRDPAKTPAITAEALELILKEVDRQGLKVLPLQDILG